MQHDGTTALPYTRQLAKMLLMIVALLTVTHLVMQYLNLEAYGQQNGQIYELSNRLDMDDEASVPTWFSQLFFMIAAVGSFLAAAVQVSADKRRIWWILGGIGVYFSVDEAAGLHEYLLQTVHVLAYQESSPTFMQNAWWLLAPVLVAVAGWLLWRMLKLLPLRTVLLFAAGGAFFVIGAVLIDVIANTTPRETFLNQGIMVALEETMELVGSVTIIYAVSEYLEGQHPRVWSGLIRAFRPRS